MGSPEAAPLLSLAESIADGESIDWSAAEARAGGADEAIVRQLRVISELAELHRSVSTVTMPPPDAARSRQGSAAPAIGSWGHLTLLERLGGGSSGDVYRAWDRDLQRDVALKLLRFNDSIADLDTSRITREGRLLARVRHANVITVYGVAAHDNRVGLWMELVRGATLEQQIRTSGPLGAHEAALVGIDLCRALAAIHAAGLIHRDVKAQNVMREGGGRIVLMDLGTGREVGTPSEAVAPDLAGTPLYLAPELFSGARASERTDLYSLGVLLYHLVTGIFPIRATTIQELHQGHTAGRLVRLRDARPDLPSAFVRVVERAIARDARVRYATAGEFEADLAHALEGFTVPGAARAPSGGRGVVSRVPSRFVTIGVTAALVCIVALGVWMLQRGSGLSGPAGTVRSMAVLPLVNLSGDASQDYFADGMTDELIATLGRIGALNVISRTSVIAFKNSKQSLPQIARALNVDAVLEGSVFIIRGRGDGGADASRGRDRVRINARLIHAGSDLQLWTKTFEEEITNVLNLQREVAAAVANEIHIRLTPEEERDFSTQAQRDQAAQDAYLQGRYLLNNLSRPNLIAARDQLQRAIQLDPGDARAYASLAWCYSFLELYGVLGHFEAASLANAAASTAVRLNDRLAEAHSRLADVALQYQWDWVGAERSYRRALELNPSHSYTRSQYARFLMAQGRLAEALQQAKRAEQVDPLSPEAKEAVALALYYDRRYDEAITQLRAARDLAPQSAQAHFGLGRVYAGKGANAQAIDELIQAASLSGRSPGIVAELARTYAVSGRKSEAEQLIAELNDRSREPDYHVSPQALAYIYAALGDRDRAFELLTRAFDDRMASVLWLKVDPRVDSLRQDPRYAALVLRLGLDR